MGDAGGVAAGWRRSAEFERPGSDRADHRPGELDRADALRLAGLVDDRPERVLRAVGRQPELLAAMARRPRLQAAPGAGVRVAALIAGGGVGLAGAGQRPPHSPGRYRPR